VIYLITGQPGNGKTLHALSRVEQLRTETGRVVYQNDIPELTLEWQKLDDPRKWFEVPSGSVVVIDECQRVFPPRRQGAQVPVEVAEFETHRHKGFDVFLITQHPQLLDIAVRKLVGRHFHIVRTFGQNSARIFQWERCVDPHDRSVQKEAQVSRWSYPPEVFTQYRSAEIHTVKKELPWRKLGTVAACALLVPSFFWFGFHRLTRKKAVVEDAAVSSQTASAKGPPTVADFLPFAERWPWSAPYYQTVVKVVSAPRITGCMVMQVDNSRTCSCSDGHGRASVTAQVCYAWMAGERFDPARPVEDLKAVNIRYLDRSLSQSPTDAQAGGSGSSEPVPE